jgi:hypothetical protein
MPNPYRTPSITGGAVLAAIVFCAWLSATALADAPGPAPGEYLDEGGGMLHVIRNAGSDGGDAFVIDTRGPNGHMCHVTGDVVDGDGVAADDLPGETCKVGFSLRAKGVVVVSGSQSCRGYCGTRAGFDGSYARPSRLCRTDERLKADEAFHAAYRAGRYRQALAVLKPVLDRCSPSLFYRDRDRMTNDVAITQFHVGHRADCLATLEPLRDDAESDDDELSVRWNGLPADIDNARRTAAMTRTNLALCRGRAITRGR